MSPLFGNKGEKAAKRAVADAAVERLIALSVWELAAEVLPVFGANGIHSGGMTRWTGELADEIAKLLLNASGAGSLNARSVKALSIPILEAIQALENAGLLLRTLEVRQRSGSYDLKEGLQITRLGQAALDEDRARLYLQDRAAANPESFQGPARREVD
jgi:hypothetical protein